jgi:Ca2+-binding RTX toxin-like protein
LTDHDETVLAGLGDDRILMAGGNDTVQGEDGNDVISGGGGNDHLDGGAGTDTVDYSGMTGVNLNLAQGRAVIGSEVDTLVAIETVIGSSANDVLVGDTSDNNLIGGLGDDRLDGSGGADVLSGGLGGDRIDGGTGNDALAGENGDDWLFGGTGDDMMQGGVGADRLYGGDGNDSLIGGPGADRLTGGAGADRFVLLTPFDGPDQFLDFTSGEDKIAFDADGFSLGISEAVLTPTADPHVWEFLYANGTDVLVYATLSYDVASGWLRWDWTQDSPGDAVHLATLPGTELTINDFIVT